MNRFKSLYNEELKIKIEKYEDKCVTKFLNKNFSIKENINKIKIESEKFLKEKESYLQQFQKDEEVVKSFNKNSKDLQSKLKEENNKLNKLLFDDKLIEFRVNNSKINEFE